MYAPSETAAKISRIADQVKDLTVYDDLFDIKEFLEIYEHPQSYVEAAMALIPCPDLSTFYKQIIALAMQRLPLTQFLALLSVTSDAVEKQTTNAEVLELMSFAPLNWGTQELIVNYENPAVRAWLHRLKKIAQLSDDAKILIERILTGRAKQDLQEYREMRGYYTKPKP